MELLNKTLTEIDILDKREIIFNCKESDISLNASTGKVVVCRNSKHEYTERKGASDHSTAHACVSVAGIALPSMLIFEMLIFGHQHH